jgi:uncharacterized protein (DUF433 family)
MTAGRTRLLEPSNRDQHILEALRDGHSQAKVARTYGISRQYVHEITTRWPKLAPKKKIKRHHG